MRFTAALTVTGVIGFLVLEALKILLAPAAFWLLGIAMVAVKALLMVLMVIAAVAAVAGGIWAYKRWSKDPDEIVV